MTIKEIKTNDLKPYENNPRNNDTAVEAVANSIREFGFKVPIVIDKNNVIVAGHTRWKAANMLGLDKVPCFVADDLTDEQIKAFRLADNKVAELATWDFEKLETELLQISNDFDMGQFGFDELEEPGFDELENESIGDEDKVTVRIVFINNAEWMKHEDELRRFAEKYNADIVVGNK
jgi:ParB-like chromosome segregation protein Spo0J